MAQKRQKWQKTGKKRLKTSKNIKKSSKEFDFSTFLFCMKIWR